MDKNELLRANHDLVNSSVVSSLVSLKSLYRYPKTCQVTIRLPLNTVRRLEQISASCGIPRATAGRILLTDAIEVFKCPEIFLMLK